VRLLGIACLVLLAACGRPLAPAERGFLATFHGAGLDYGRVRIGDGFQPLIRTVPTPPRITCQQKLYPPIATRTITGGAPAMTLFNTVFLRDDWASDNLTGDWPRVLDLQQALLLMHEAVHVWQWQQRRSTRYHPVKAALEHVGSPDPYLFDPATRADFASFGYEQQGAIAEEYLCCSILAPDAERTRRLHAMLAEVLPLSPLSTPIAERVRLPWKGVEIGGICD
jgi:hypothetical protein